MKKKEKMNEEAKMPEDPIDFPNDSVDETADDNEVNVEVMEEDEEGEVDEENDELAELKDRYMRLLAEYDNFRRRSQKEKESLYSEAVADVSKEFLAIVDNIDRAVESTENMTDMSAEKVAEGITMIAKQTTAVLSKLGIEEIQSEKGETFDPNFHEAVMHVEDDSLGEQAIAEVFQKGYICKGKVIRHTVCKVGN